MAKKMSELKTEELTEILKQTTDIDVFLDDNELLPNVSLAEYINELVEEKKTKIADVARKAHMSSSYLYKLGEENVSHRREIKPCRFVSDLDWI